jgi:fermentation-respiration switch protein FrsA (DUF1100 family)
LAQAANGSFSILIMPNKNLRFQSMDRPSCAMICAGWREVPALESSKLVESYHITSPGQDGLHLSDQNNESSDQNYEPAGNSMQYPRLRRFAVISGLILGLLLVVLYVAGGLLIHDQRFADYCVLAPYAYNEKCDITLPGIDRKPLSIPTSDGQKLDGWLFIKPGATKLTIVNHGNAGNMTSRGFYVQAFTNAGTNVLLYDYRGYGSSSGEATVSGALDDGVTAYQYARNKLGYPAAKIIEFGESLGTAVACHVASRETCAALMLFAPLDSLPSAGRSKVPILSLYPDFCFAQQLNNVEAISKYHSAVFICHGQKDDLLSPAGSQKLYDVAAQPKTLVFLPDTSHFMFSDADTIVYLKAITEFVAKLK